MRKIKKNRLPKSVRQVAGWCSIDSLREVMQQKNSKSHKARPSPLSPEQLESRELLTVGGGIANAGLVGQYYASNDLSGTPLFTRNDVRVDFNTGGGFGGSISGPIAALPAHNFSVRWTGQVIPRFSETYTLTTTASDGIRLYIQDPTTMQWTTVINDWPATGQAPTTVNGTYAFTAGKLYNIKIEYHDLSDAPIASVSWSSPSTPSEVLEPVNNIGFNVNFASSYDPSFQFADAIKSARSNWATIASGSTPAPHDANGWPTTDAQLGVWEGIGADGSLNGTYTLTFNGQADISTFGPVVVGTSTYDPATNTTTATLVDTFTGNQNFSLVLKNTRQTAGSSLNTGVTNVKLMRPTYPGSTTSYPADTLYTTQFEKAVSQFTTLRTMPGTNGNQSVNWSDRTTPSYFTQFGPYVPGEMAEGNGVSWEDRVMLANETGKDLYINIPELATGSSPSDTTSYVYQLAEVIKNGDTIDGVKYPGLNPNLKLYVEYSNEVWNFAYPQWRQNYDAAQAAVANHTSDGAILAYDGTTDSNILATRRIALRDEQASTIFRAVFGDAAMGSTVRFLDEFQYDNAGFPPTASTELNFLNNYFNNGDGTSHVTTPHPVSYYMWGAGGAAYYFSNNDSGAQNAITFGDAGFEAPAVTNFVAAPSGTPWAFSGTSGLAANGSTLGNPTAPDGTQVAYLEGIGSINGSFSQVVNFSSAGTYSIQFQAVAATGSSEPITVYFDGQSLGTFSPNSTGFKTFVSHVVTLSAAGNHTVTFTGAGVSGTNYAFIDSVAVTSVDAIFNSGLPSTGYQAELNTEVDWARLYGLQDVAYESGWALGGDSGASALQTYAKFSDPRAQAAQTTATNDFFRAGGSMLILGTYSQWDKLSDALTSYLTLSVQASQQALPVSTANGVQLPQSLTPANMALNNNDSGGALSTGGWIDWNVLAPYSGNYVLTPSFGTGGTAQLSLDATPFTSGSSSQLGTVSIYLTQGLHTLSVQALSGAFRATSISVYSPGSPSSLSAEAGTGMIGLNWSPATGVTVLGYNVYRGTVAGGESTTPLNTTPISGTSYLDTTAVNGTTYYYVVAAVTTSGISHGSNEVSATANTSVEVVGYNLNGLPGDEVAASATTSAPSVSISPLSRGAGLQPIFLANTISSIPTGNVYGTSLADAIAKNQYYTFSLTTTSGAIASLGTLSFSAWGQNDTSTFGAGLQMSVDGVNFSKVPLIGSVAGATYASPKTVSANLSQLTQLQNFTGTVTFRFFLYGIGNYCSSGLTLNSGDAVDLIGSVQQQQSQSKPGAPTAVAATAGTGKINLSWAAPSGTVTGYNLYRSTTAGGEGTTPYVTGITTTNYVDSGLSNGQTYYYYVTAYNSAGESTPSAEVNATTTAAPTVAKAAAATLSSAGTTASLSVLGADPTGESNLTYTWVAMGTPPAPVTFSANGTNAAKLSTVTFQKAGNYTFQVTIQNAAGLTATSSVTLTVGQVLTSLSVSSASATVSDGATDQFTATAYDQFKTAMAASPSWAVSGIGGTVSSSGLYTAPAAGSGVATVTASAAGVSGSANVTVVVAKPAAPTGVAAAAGTGKISLAWTAPSGSVTGYNLYRSTTAGGEGTTPYVAGITSTSYVDSGLSNGQTYYYYVTAYNSGGESTASTEVHATTTAPPTVAKVAAATLSSAGTTASLSVLGADPTGESNLTYTWVATGTPPAPVTFSANGTTAAKLSTVNFQKAGSYTFQVTIQNAAGLTATSSVTLTVGQVLTGLTVTPTSGTIGDGVTDQTKAAGTDQFNNPLTTLPGITWTVGGLGGSINSTGLYTAPTTGSGTATVVGTASGVSATANIRVTSAPPANGFVADIKFTNSTSNVVAGYSDDIGTAYGLHTNGLMYGWNQDNTANMRERFSTNSPDLLHDGLGHMQKPSNPNAWWAISVPNGTYSVDVLSGDPDNIDSVYKINVGGTLNAAGAITGGVTAVQGTPTSQVHWFENSVTVTVTNGVLYVSNAAGSVNNKIDAIKITELGGLNFAGGFAGATGLTLNGSAKFIGPALQLTDSGNNEAGSAFTASAVGITSFSSTFQFQLTNATADGFAFVIQGAGANALGASGGGLGYAGIANSLAVKFDLYNNSGEGNDSTGLFVNGANPVGTSSVDLTSSGVNLHSGDLMTANVNYDGTTLQVTITDTVTGKSASQSYKVNIASIVGGPTAFVGFTAGTGALTANQTILNWTFAAAA